MFVNLINRRFTNIVICYIGTIANDFDIYYVKYILNTLKYIIRSVTKLYFIKKKLEVVYYGRKYIKKMFILTLLF